MGREIKFRGKSISGDWVYGNLIIEDDECYISTGFPGIALDEGYWANSYGYPPSSSDFHITNIHEIIPKTVGQFTGLKDKNGVEIYEGDLLRYPPESKWDEDNYSCFEVFFHNGNANSDYNIGYSISRMHNYGVVCGGYIPSFKPKTVTKMIVIGNIHDNL